MTTRLLYTFSLVLFFALLLAPPSLAEPPKPIGPRIKIEPQSIDFGTIDTNDPVTKTVRVTNTGDQTLETKEQCCGMVINPWRRTIAPGESVDFPITVAPRNQRPGAHKSSRTIRSNDPAQLHSKIEVLAFYRPLVYLEPPVIQLGTILPGNGGRTPLTINCRDENFEIVSIDTGNAHFTTQPSDDDIKSEDINYPGRKVVNVILEHNTPTGHIFSTAKIKVRARPDPANPRAEPQEVELSASVIGHVLGDLAVEPRFIRVAQAFHGETFTEKILISSSTGRAFTITSCKVVESTLPGVTARTELVDEAQLKGHYLILEGTGSDTPGMFRGYVEITTDIPDESPLRVQFNGFTREKPR